MENRELDAWIAVNVMGWLSCDAAWWIQEKENVSSWVGMVDDWKPTTDLNACRWAELKLNHDQQVRYMDALAPIMKRPPKEAYVGDLFCMVVLHCPVHSPLHLHLPLPLHSPLHLPLHLGSH